MWFCAEPNGFNAGATSHTPAFSLSTVVGPSGFLPVMSYFAPVGWLLIEVPLAHSNGFDKCIEAPNVATVCMWSCQYDKGFTM